MALLHTENPVGVAILCDNCFSYMTCTRHIRCCECATDLCMHCFASQTETMHHSKYHHYRTVSQLYKQVDGSGWTLLEEALFIEGLEAFGIGNWAEIESHVGGRKDVKQHFYKLLGIHDDERCQHTRCKQSNPYRGCVSSYMPLRKDFDVEYLNDQEAIMMNLRTDSKSGTMLTEAMLDSYVKIVMFRRRWKYAILEKAMVDVMHIKKSESIANQMNMHGIKCIAPYMTRSDFNTFFNGIYIEKHLYRMLMKQSMLGRHHSIDVSDALKCIAPANGQLSRDGFLSENEKKLCKSTGISFGKYIDSKAIAIGHLLSKTRLSSKDLGAIFQNPADAEKAYQLLHDQGWIWEQTN
ncbi:hypothetical protein HK407_04g07820 [Ordospora pajunii]|uniref:uncharacterized protein n=1 Tax=Ordospora pajunii TaxID=3039483 RepID=UPI0029527A34|nr:uncharacterized protein HK407_04g07820 [Ordospora pajunii]KAH9411674.1 hypothetical protein HK407_04g07820 [Ordospora pajunii]